MNEKGKLIDKTDEIAPQLRNVGMITDAVWSDYDKDGWADLIVVGEWMPITIFENNVSISQPENVGTNTTTGFEFNGKYTPTNWLTLNSDFNINYFNRKGDYEMNSFDFKGNRWSGSLTSKLKLPFTGVAPGAETYV